MDEYYLSRDDWDTIVELGVDGNKSDLILKKISAATKTTLTKKWVHIFFIHICPLMLFIPDTTRANTRLRSTGRIWGKPRRRSAVVLCLI
jgi:hypothetical protein